MLILLGGPPGVGKSSVCARLSTMGWHHIEADTISPPDADVERTVSIDQVASQVEAELHQHSQIVLSWVFARPELYLPFSERFADAPDLHQMYLVCSETQLRNRLKSRNSSNLLQYSLSRLQLINELSFEKIDTTNMEVNSVADILFARFSTAP